MIITDEKGTNYNVDTMINTIDDIINNNVLLDGYKEFNIYGVTTKTNINIFVNSNNVILRLYDDLTIIDKIQYSCIEYKKTLQYWLKYINYKCGLEHCIMLTNNQNSKKK